MGFLAVLSRWEFKKYMALRDMVSWWMGQC